MAGCYKQTNNGLFDSKSFGLVIWYVFANIKINNHLSAMSGITCYLWFPVMEANWCQWTPRWFRLSWQFSQWSRQHWIKNEFQRPLHSLNTKTVLAKNKGTFSYNSPSSALSPSGNSGFPNFLKGRGGYLFIFKFFSAYMQFYFQNLIDHEKKNPYMVIWGFIWKRNSKGFLELGKQIFIVNYQKKDDSDSSMRFLFFWFVKLLLIIWKSNDVSS